MSLTNRRILLIDDLPSIHEDYKKILGTSRSEATVELDAARSAFLGAGGLAEEQVNEPDSLDGYVIDSAYQGQDGLELVKQAIEEGNPYALAFVDVRMPPGWDGIKTIQEIWKVDSEIEIVICTAYSDYSWHEMISALGKSDRLLILKKPFDPVEINQLAAALTAKWNVRQSERKLVSELRDAEASARSYASSLTTLNRALMTSQTAAERSVKRRGDFLGQLSSKTHGVLSDLLDSIPGEPQADKRESVEAGRELLTVLDQVVALKKCESGEMSINNSPVTTIDLLSEALLDDEGGSGTPEIKLNVLAPLPEVLSVDRRQLLKVMRTLVQAGRCCSMGRGIEVDIDLAHTGSWESSVLSFSVTDFGPMVAEEFRAGLFEAFGYQRQGAVKLGIGLPLAQQLVTLMRGELSYSVREDQGNRFTAKVEVVNVPGARLIEPGDFILPDAKASRVS